MLVDVEGTRINVIDEGTGHPVLFLHGLGGCWRDWEPQLETLTANFRCVVPEFRGHGRSDRPLGRYSTALFADDVAGLCSELGLSHAYVVGLSMGGMVAQTLAVEHPGLVDGLVLADTTSHVGADAADALRGALPLIREQGMALVQAFAASAMAADEALSGGSPTIRRNNLRESSGNDPLAYASSLQALIEHPELEGLGHLQVPTLVLRGEHDVLAGEDGARELADAIPGAEFAVIPGAGHLANLDQPARFDALCQDFVARHPCTAVPD